MSGLRFDSVAKLPPAARQKIYDKLRQDAIAERQRQEEIARHQKLKFRSTKEQSRYAALVAAQEDGFIFDLRIREEITLKDGYTTPEGERVRPVRYIAVFSYKTDNILQADRGRASAEDLRYWGSLYLGAKVIEATREPSGAVYTDLRSMGWEIRVI